MRSVPIVCYRPRCSTPQRRIFLLPSARTGFSFLELLCVIAIIASTCCVAIPALNKFLYQQRAAFALEQIDLIIAYARSNSMAHEIKTIICPSHNGYSCGNSWNQGVLVTAENLAPQYFKIPTGSRGLLYLTQSGNMAHMLTINPDGFALSNGHFGYRTLNTGWPEYKLYFNRALRTYSN